MFKIVNDSPFDLPKYAKYGDAGMDLKADLSSSEKVKIGSGEPVFDGDVLILKPNCRVIIPTSIRIELPIGFEAQIRPRSGLSIKTGLTVYLGTIDASYRGEIGVIVGNYTNKNIEIPHGERIAQMVISKHEIVEWEEVEELSETERGGGGFGHTGRM